MACPGCWFHDDGTETCSPGSPLCKNGRKKTQKQVYQKYLNIAFVAVALFVIAVLASCHKVSTQEEIYQKWPNLKENYTTIDTTGQYLIPRGPVSTSAYLYE